MSVIKRLLYIFTLLLFIAGIFLMLVMYNEFKTIEKEHYMTYSSDYEVKAHIVLPSAAKWRDANGESLIPKPYDEVTVIEPHYGVYDVIYKQNGKPVSVAHEVPKSALDITEEQDRMLIENSHGSSFVWSIPVRGRHYSETTILLAVLLFFAGILNNMTIIYHMTRKEDFYPTWKRSVLTNLVFVGIVAMWMI